MGSKNKREQYDILFAMSATVEAIREKVSQGLFQFSKHATDMLLLRTIAVQEVREAIPIQKGDYDRRLSTG